MKLNEYERDKLKDILEEYEQLKTIILNLRNRLEELENTSLYYYDEIGIPRKCIKTLADRGDK